MHDWREVVSALRRASETEQSKMLDQLAATPVGGNRSGLDVLPYLWEAWGRDHQQMPTEEQWETLFLCCGRGGGKTRTGAELTIQAVRDHDVGGHVALIAPTYADIAAVMVEGESGILACSPPWFTPRWKPSGSFGGELLWPNGVIGYCFTAERPEQIRGVQFGWYWGDEIAKWDLEGGDGLLVKSNVDFAHRLGSFRRGIYTSTPKPTPLICSLEDASLRDLAEIEEGKRQPSDRTVILRSWSSTANADNIGKKTLAKWRRDYEGTTKGREELDAEIIRDDPGALWSIATLDLARVEPEDVPALRCVVVAVDNALTKAKPGQINTSTVESRNRAVGPADTGIIVAGLGEDGLYYLLGDWTVNDKPGVWGKQVLSAFAKAWPGRVADFIVVEKNAGGDLIKANLDVVMSDLNIPRDRVPIKYVTARDGKDARAEPVISLYEQGRVKHAAKLPDLEFQQSRFKRGKTSYKKDRVDAMVWAITSLIDRSEVVEPKPFDRSVYTR